MICEETFPPYIYITDGKYHDSNILDVLVPEPEAIYLMDKANIDFAALYLMHKAGSFFVTRAKVTLDYENIEHNYNIDERTGLRCDKTTLKELLTDNQVNQNVKEQSNLLTLKF